jgi:hypothetical protein
MNSITFDQRTINDINAGSMDIDIFIEDLQIPHSSENAKCVVIQDHGFVLSRNYNSEDSLLTISLKESGPLYGLDIPSRRTALNRIFACTVLMLEGKPLPKSYSPFHGNNLFSFYADNFTKGQFGIKGRSGRIVMTYPLEKPRHLLAFLIQYTQTVH